MTNEASRGRWFGWRSVVRLPLLLAHVLIGIPLTLLTFLPGLRDLPVGGVRLHQRSHRLWSRLMLGVFGIRLRVSGRLPEAPCLVVANHISWLDIVVLHALWPMWLVAKAEIRGWPMIGRLADLAGTLFIQRGSESSRRRVNRRMAALLKRGEKVGIFPEGGIRPEAGVGPFHARLFAAAVRVGVPVLPIAIRYQSLDDGRDLHPQVVFAPGESFLGNAARLLACRGFEVRLMIGEPVAGLDGGRSALARRSRDIVKEFYES